MSSGSSRLQRLIETKNKATMNNKNEQGPIVVSETVVEKDDQEFQKWEKTFKTHQKKIEYVKTREIEKDLFQMSDKYSLGHCVAADFGMRKGIALFFRLKFKRVEELLRQGEKTGGVAILDDGNRFIYYLVTKWSSNHKPTNYTLFASLLKLRDHIVENHVTKLAMPRIGCGLDNLLWKEVRHMLEFVFREVTIDIVICNLPQKKEKGMEGKGGKKIEGRKEKPKTAEEYEAEIRKLKETIKKKDENNRNRRRRNNRSHSHARTDVSNRRREEYYRRRRSTERNPRWYDRDHDYQRREDYYRRRRSNERRYDRDADNQRREDRRRSPERRPLIKFNNGTTVYL